MRISDEHRERYRQYYATALNRRAPRPSQWLHQVESYARLFSATTLLDYGSGPSGGIKGYTSLFSIAEYDPGVPGLDEDPSPADMVVSIHALEHVEPESLDDVVAHIMCLSLKASLVVVSCEASMKILPDHTPWHTFVRPAQWWEGYFRSIGFRKVDSRPGMEGREFAALRMTR